MIRLLLTLLFSGYWLADLTALHSDPLHVIFIIDASGSMWADMDKSTRMQQAKMVLTKLADKVPEDAVVGLIAYGHTSATDCDDIATLIPLKTFDKASFQKAVSLLEPKGKTPIAGAVQHALNSIQQFKTPVSLVVVTDGLETCDGDACAYMKQARSDGRQVTMHVIGFGITEKNLSSLECLAQAGGGQYMSADNADQLTLALEQSIQKPSPGNAYLSVKASLEGALKDATVKVFSTDKDSLVMSGRTYDHAETNPRLFQLDAGSYSLEINPVGIAGIEALRFDHIQLKDGDTIYQAVEFQQAIVKVLVTRNGVLSDGVIQVFPVGSKVAVATARSYDHAKHNPAIMKIPPGTYDIEIASVEISGRPSTRIENWSVPAAGTREITHDFKSGELLIGATRGSELVDATVNVVRIETGVSSGAGRTYMSASSNPKKFILSPGKYRIDLGPVKPQGLERKSIEVEVLAGQAITKTVTW